jgi:hypothetical protein
MLWIVHLIQLSKQEELKTEDQLIKLLKELTDQVLVLLFKILQTVLLTMEVIGLLMIATTLQSRHQKLLTQKIGIKLISIMLLPTQLMLFHKNIQVVIIMELELIPVIINQI